MFLKKQERRNKQKQADLYNGVILSLRIKQSNPPEVRKIWIVLEPTTNYMYKKENSAILCFRNPIFLIALPPPPGLFVPFSAGKK